MGTPWGGQMCMRGYYVGGRPLASRGERTEPGADNHATRRAWTWYPNPAKIDRSNSPYPHWTSRSPLARRHVQMRLRYRGAARSVLTCRLFLDVWAAVVGRRSHTDMTETTGSLLFQVLVNELNRDGALADCGGDTFR
jgi:hypothetical protein